MSKDDFKVRCIKCGSEFSIKNGVIKQKKSAKVKRLPKGVTITKFSDTNLEFKQNQELNRIIKQTEHVKMLNKIAKDMRHRQ